MAIISIDEVKRVAALSKIAVTDDEATKLQVELGAILDYVKQLDTVDVAGFGPTYQVTGLNNVTRADEVQNYGVSQADLLKNAPHSQGNQIKVPKVL